MYGIGNPVDRYCEPTAAFFQAVAVLQIGSLDRRMLCLGHEIHDAVAGFANFDNFWIPFTGNASNATVISS